MADAPGDWPPPLIDAIEQEAEAMCRRYRVNPEQARQSLYAALTTTPGLVERACAQPSAKEIARLSAFKAAVKAARKDVYYRLRQYRRDDAAGGASQSAPTQSALAAQLKAQVMSRAPAEEIHATRQALLAAHASTRERDQEAFFRALFDHMPAVTTILDIGCGLQPLAYPFDSHPVALYVAVDRDPDAIQVLETFAPAVAPARLVALHAEFADFSWSALAALGVVRFDLALMLKIVPIIRRQQRDLLPMLAAAPARRALVTGNTESLTRHESIRVREDRVLRAFIATSERRVIARFETPGEFGYVLE